MRVLSSLCRTLFLVLCAVALLISSRAPGFATTDRSTPLPFAPLSTGTRPDPRSTIDEMLGSLPIRFEENRGQFDPSVRFASRGNGYSLAFANDEIAIALAADSPALRPAPDGARTTTAKAQNCRMRFAGARRPAQISGIDRLATKSNYFAGADAGLWRTDVANFGGVRYENLYRGIDAVFYGNRGQVEYDLLVAPGADPKAIRLAFAGAHQIGIDADGDLNLKIAAGEIRQRKPVAYQVVGGARRTIPCAFKLVASQRKGQAPEVAFELSDYDRSNLLVIDPVLDFSTYLGGGNNLSYNGADLALDADENVYIVGYTFLLPVPGGTQTQESLDHPAVFIAKIDSRARRLAYFTSLSGAPGSFHFSFGLGIAVTAAGSVYVTGATTSLSFPTTAGAFQTTLQGSQNAFVTRLNAEGNELLYSTLLGASDPADESTRWQCTQQNGGCTTMGLDIAVDSSGSAHLTGHTNAASFPVTAGAFKPVKSRDDCTSVGGGTVFVRPCTEAFVTRLNPAGTSLLYSSFLGGDGNDSGESIALDDSGNAYVVGTTEARDFPTRNALYDTFRGGDSDAFLAKVSADGTALLASTYLGGSGNETAREVALDRSGEAYLVGDTTSTDLPTTDAVFQAQPSSATLFKTTDGGASWRPLYRGLHSNLGITAVAVDPNDPASLFLATNRGVYRSTDGGDTWVPASETRLSLFFFLAFAPQNPAVAFAKIFGLRGNDTLLRSTDGGATWGEISYPTLNASFVRINRLHVDPTNVQTFYLSETTHNEVGRVLKTTDGGATWALMDQGLPLQTYPGILGINPRSPAALFARAGRLFRSPNGGIRWKPNSLDDPDIHRLGFDQAATDVVYAVSERLHKSTDGGVTWGRVETNLTSFGDLLVSGNTLHTVSAGAVFKSTDGGRAWADVGTAARVTNISTLASDPKNPSMLYAASGRVDTDAFVMRLNASASAVRYSTYLGGRLTEIGHGIAVDEAGSAAVAGSTDSPDFPTRNAIQSRSISSTEAFVTRLTPGGAAVYSTYLGGNNSDVATGVAIDSFGRAYVVGTTYSDQFPQVTPLQPFMGVATFLSRIVDGPPAGPAPVVAGVTPTSGASIGQTLVTITGANFLPGATVSFGSSRAQAVTVVDANTIQATTPPHFSERATIVVMNPDGQVGVLERAFDFLLTPVIQQVMIVENRLVLYTFSFINIGYGFDNGAVLLIDGQEVKTDPVTSSNILSSKKALKRIRPGQSVVLQVRNANGLVSAPFPYRRV